MRKIILTFTICGVFSISSPAKSPVNDTAQNAPKQKARQGATRKTAQTSDEIDFPVALKKIKLPPGFKISLYAKVPGARSMALSQNGTLFVGTGGLGGDFKRVYTVRDLNQDGVADEVKILADGLNVPNGVAFKDGDLYVAELSKILRFRGIEAKLNNPGKPEVFADGLPDDSYHGWKFIRFAPDGSLMVPQGAPCNVCDVDANHGVIYKISPDGKTRTVVAKGVRNSVGFDFHPVTQDMIFTDNGRDMMGEDIPFCELNRLPAKNWRDAKAPHYGFPHCHSGRFIDPEFHHNHECSDFVAPVMNFAAHVAPLGTRFYTGKMFPKEFSQQIFVAEHGSWNRTVPQGYRVSMAWSEDNGKSFQYKMFAEGWLDQDGKAWGRPVDVEVLKDGSMLISDDLAGAIYRVVYKP
jgi:glucose/arabinose dehydrogenase